MPRALALVLAIATWVVVAACGGDDDRTPADAWARQVCTALGAWLDGIGGAGDQLDEALRTAPGTPQARAQLVAFLDRAVGLTDGLRVAVARAGVPAVDDGEGVQRDLDRATTEARVALDSARSRVVSIAPDDATAFTSTATQIGRDLETVGARVRAVSRSRALGDAFGSEPSCRPFREEG